MAMAIGIVIALIVVATLLYLDIYGIRRHNLPPGPYGIPFVGNIGVVLGSNDFCQALADLGKRYGQGLFTLKVFHKRLVIINDWTSMKEALVTKSAIFSARPRFFAVDYTMKQSDIASCNGTAWKEKRRFTTHHLKNLGFGKSSMESHILNEAQRVMKFMEEKHNDNQIEMCEIFLMPVLNVLWGIISGKAYEYDDVRMTEFLKIAVGNFDSLVRTMPLNFFPILRFLPFDLFRFKMSLRDSENTYEYYDREVQQHLQTYQNGDRRDFIDIFLAKMFEQADIADNNFQRRHLVGILDNLLIAGVETTSSTLEWGFLYMALWPEIQDKIQKEIDDVVGRHRLPNMQDLPQLTYTEATIMEIQRCASVLPMMYHAPVSTTTVSKYTIPKGTWVFRNIWAIHNDKDLWGDPEVFRPERFIAADGTITKPEYLIPFSTGVRYCLGEPLARVVVFIFFTSILQRFKFRCVVGQELPSLEPILAVTRKPKPFSLNMQLR